jgi:hypothetical protein
MGIKLARNSSLDRKQKRKENIFSYFLFLWIYSDHMDLVTKTQQIVRENGTIFHDGKYISGDVEEEIFLCSHIWGSHWPLGRRQPYQLPPEQCGGQDASTKLKRLYLAIFPVFKDPGFV